MSAPLTYQAILERNKKIATTHEPHPFISEMGSSAPPPPSFLILTCIDPRCVPEETLGLQRNEAVVVRTAGGRMHSAFASFLPIDTLLNFKEMMERAPAQAEEIEGMEWGAIADLEQSVRNDIEMFKASELVRKELRDNVHGFVYDIKTGLLSEVAV
ncbi:MAG: hypothetical protein Q9220_005044 [cf. Caloplaca sp. 1 TL-2023]